MKTEPLVCVVIVSWNSEKDIKTCINSLLLQDYKNFKIIVVDNASSDSAVQIVRENYIDKVDLLDFKANYFLTGGNNRGIEYAIEKYDPKYVMVLNPDTRSESNLISSLVKTAETNNEIGAVGPKVKFFNNKNEGLINSAGLKFDGFMQAYDIGFMEKDKGQYDFENEVFGVTGACILFRVEMLKEIGFYWERIKLYLDEVEMFIRARKAGWSVVYNGKTTIWHSYMQSMSQEKIEKVNKLKREAWLWIALRHYPFKSKLAMIRKYFS